MEEKKFVKFKKEELAIKNYVRRALGKGKISAVTVEYTPVGEKIIISTDKPGMVIGSRGKKIEELTQYLKKQFKLENPHIEIDEITKPEFDSTLIADRIAISLEKFGNIRFKKIAYRELTRIIRAGALGVEIRLSGKLPGDRAKSWRFAAGYLKKVGDSSKVVDSAQSTALTKTGIIGIKVKILSPDAKLYDRINIDQVLKDSINSEIEVKDTKIKNKNEKNEI